MTKKTGNKGFWSKLIWLLFSKEAIMETKPGVPTNKPKNLSEDEFSAAYFHGRAHVETFFAELSKAIAYADGPELYKALGVKPRKVAEADKGLPTFLGLLKSLETSNLPPWEVYSLKEYAYSQKHEAWLAFYRAKRAWADLTQTKKA